MLCDKTWPNWVGMPKEGLKELLKVIDDHNRFTTIWQFCFLRLAVAVLLNSELAKCKMVLPDDVKLTRVFALFLIGQQESENLRVLLRRNDLNSRMFCLFVEESRVDVSENQKCCRVVRTSSSHFDSFPFLFNIYLFYHSSVEVGRLFR